MTCQCTDESTIRRIVKDELNNQQYINSLLSALYPKEPPLSQYQTENIVDGKLGRYALTLNEKVIKQVEKTLTNRHDIQTMLDDHRETTNTLLRNHQLEVSRMMNENKTGLKRLHYLQIVSTKAEMEHAATQVVNKMLTTDDGGTIVKCLDEKSKQRLEKAFYGTICFAVIAGFVGGIVGSQINK